MKRFSILVWIVPICLLSAGSAIAQSNVPVAAVPAQASGTSVAPQSVGVDNGVAYLVDDGTSENGVGMVFGGEILWMNAFLVTPGNEVITRILTTWGSTAGTNYPPGGAARVFLYEDPDDDGNPDDAVLLVEQPVVVVSTDDDVFQSVDIPATLVSGWFFVAASAPHAAGQFPLPLDQTSSSGQSWLAGSSGVVDANDLTNNDIPIVQIDTYFPGNVMVRADVGVGDTDGDGVLDGDDLCAGTVIPERVPSIALEPNRFALVTANRRFDTIKHGVISRGPTGFTTTATGGCSCGQIVAAMNAGARNLKYGCERDLMRTWIALVSTRVRAGETYGLAGIGVADQNDVWALSPPVLPAEYALEGNYPNPFNPVTTIRFDMPEAARVHLSVFDVMGREVRVLVQGTLEAGRHEASFDGAGLPSGTYLYRLTTPAGVFSKTMVLLK